jgi:hypothetical protein
VATEPFLIISGFILVASLALSAGRFSIFRNDLQRSISLGVCLLSLLMIALSVDILTVGFRLRQASLQAADASLAAEWNGLLLGAILLLLVSSLAFFFAMGVFIWSLVPPRRPDPKDRRPPFITAFEGLETPQQSLIPAHHR